MAQPVPWRRILAESLAIISSILIAFAIDAAWDVRNERADRKDVTAALQRDFLENREAISAARTFHVAHLERLAALGTLTSAQASLLSPDTVSALAALGTLAPPRSFEPARGTIDALIGAGRLDLLRDPDLRNAVVTFLNELDDMEEEAGYMGRAAERVWIFEEDHGGPWLITSFPLGLLVGVRDAATELNAAALAEMRADTELMGAIRTFQRTALLYLGDLRRLSLQVDSVLTLLETSPQ